MKKIVSILLSLLLVLSLAACMKVKAGESSGKSDTAAVTAQPTAEPTAAPTPEPTEVPFEAVLIAANEKLAQVKSLHMDMDLTMEMELTIAMGELRQSMPMNVHMIYAVDSIQDPYVAKMDLSLSSMGEEMQGLIYAVRDGENTVLYTSDDDGVTWRKNTNPEEAASTLPQSPEETFSLFNGIETDIQKTGTQELNGKLATVYSGKVSGKFLQQILSTTGAAGELTEAMGVEMTEETLANLSDILVTVLIDEESGLPVRYTIDMTDAMHDIMEAAMLASMGGELPESVEVILDMPVTMLDMILSNFNSVEPIEIPEAALNAPEL